MAAEGGARGFARNWSELSLWSPKTFVRNAWRWPADQIKPLAQALKARRLAANSADAGLKLLSLRFDGSMDERPAAPGSLKGKLFVAQSGDVVFSKIDLRNGAIGIVPPAFEKAAFTAEFPIYQVQPDVADSRYIQVLFRSDFFRATINGMVSGASGRKRVAPEQLEAMPVPLPPMDVQRAIVTQWEQAQAEVQRAEAQAAEREAQAQADFLAALGLSVPAQPQDKRRAFALNFSAMERWGVDVNQPGDKFDVAQGIYPVTALGDVIADLSNGWSPQCLNRPAQGNEWGVLKLGAVSFGRFDATENKAMPEGLKPMPSLEIKPGDWLISRANIARLVGACALVDKTPPHLLLCDKIFRAVWRSDSPALPAYLDAALKLPHLRHQIEGALTGTSPTMKNISKPALLALRLPLPPLDIQKALVEAIAQARTEAAQWRTRAAQVREQARLALERALLGASGENS